MSAKVSPIGRCTWAPSLFEPSSFDGNDDNVRYSCVVEFTPDDVQELEKQATAALYEARIKLSEVGGQYNPFKVQENGNVRVRFKSKNKPPVVSQSGKPVTKESGLVYSGCWGRVGYSVYTYSNRYGKGFGFNLEAFQKARDDEPLGRGPVDTNELFDTLPEEQQALGDLGGLLG